MPVDIFAEGQKCGFLNVKRQGLYSRFYGEVDTKELSRVYGIFEGGEVLVGVPVPEQGRMVLRASMPSAKLPRGRFLRGELRAKEPEWSYFPGGTIAGVRYAEGQRKGDVLRFSWKPGERLPADEVLLFYRFVAVNGQGYLELPLDGIIGEQSNR